MKYEVQLKRLFEKFLLKDQQLLPAFLHTFLNLTQHQETEEEATEEEGGGQPDTASLVILLVGGLLLFLFYLALKYYTTDSLRWI